MIQLDRLGYEAYMAATGATLPPWEELPEQQRVAWNAAVRAILNAAQATDAPPPILDVEKPYIPTIRVFGVVYSLRHPLQASAEHKKAIGSIAAKYMAHMGTPADQITDQMQRAMRDDMGKLIRIFIPELPPSDLELLDQGDRFRVLGACFAAYDKVVEQQRQRNEISDDGLTAEERARMQAAIASGVDTLSSEA